MRMRRISRYARVRSNSTPSVDTDVVHLRQRAAQVLNEVAEHLFGTRRIGAGQYLRVGQRVVEEVRFHLRMQQVQACHRQFLFHLGLFGRSLFVAALVGDAAADHG